MITPDFGKIISRVPTYQQGLEASQRQADRIGRSIGQLGSAGLNLYQMSEDEKRQQAQDAQRQKGVELYQSILSDWDLEDSQTFGGGLDEEAKFRRAASLMAPYDMDLSNELIGYAEKRKSQDPIKDLRKKLETDRVVLGTTSDALSSAVKAYKDNPTAENQANLEEARAAYNAQKDIYGQTYSQLYPQAAVMKEEIVEEPVDELDEMLFEIDPDSVAEDGEMTRQSMLEIARSSVDPETGNIDLSVFDEYDKEQSDSMVQMAEQMQKQIRGDIGFRTERAEKSDAAKQRQLRIEDLEKGSAAERKAAGRYEQVSMANELINKPISEAELLRFRGSGSTMVDALNNLSGLNVTPELQAAIDWSNELLRDESGAVIGRDETADFIQRYIPVAGDSQETIRRKANSRQKRMNQLKRQAGRAIKTEQPKSTKKDPLGLGL